MLYNKDNLTMARRPNQMSNLNNQTDLMLKIRMTGESLKENGLLAFHTELNDFAQLEDYVPTFFTEQFEKDLVKMMQLAKRYNDEVKELV